MYRATNKNKDLAEKKIGLIFDWKNAWKGIRVNWGIILMLFYWWRATIIFRKFHRLHEFCRTHLAILLWFNLLLKYSVNFTLFLHDCNPLTYLVKRLNCYYSSHCICFKLFVFWDICDCNTRKFNTLRNNSLALFKNKILIQKEKIEVPYLFVKRSCMRVTKWNQ